MEMYRKIIISWLFLVLAALTPAAVNAQDVASEGTMANGYVLGPGDVIEVNVLGQDDYKPRAQIQADGTVQLPFIGTVTPAEKTVQQFRDEVAVALKSGGFFSSPAVNITVVGYASRYIVVLGEVGNPGIVAIDRDYHLSEILARVGGVRDSAADQVTLRRASGEELTLDLRTIATGGSDEDPMVVDGDKVFVDKAPTFYIYGQVNSPGTYKISRSMSVRMALARGGGLTALGTDKRITIVRDGKEYERVRLTEQLLTDDVVVVGERYF